MFSPPPPPPPPPGRGGPSFTPCSSGGKRSPLRRTRTVANAEGISARGQDEREPLHDITNTFLFAFYPPAQDSDDLPVAARTRAASPTRAGAGAGLGTPTVVPALRRSLTNENTARGHAGSSSNGLESFWAGGVAPGRGSRRERTSLLNSSSPAAAPSPSTSRPSSPPSLLRRPAASQLMRRSHTYDHAMLSSPSSLPQAGPSSRSMRGMRSRDRLPSPIVLVPTRPHRRPSPRVDGSEGSSADQQQEPSSGPMRRTRSASARGAAYPSVGAEELPVVREARMDVDREDEMDGAGELPVMGARMTRRLSGNSP